MVLEGIQPPLPNQDEDIDTDEDLLIRNIKDSKEDLKKSIQDFLAARSKQSKKKQVFNFENAAILKGKCGDL